MSVRRASEAHIAFILQDTYPNATYPHQVVQSLVLTDRPNPAIIVTAGSAQVALPEQPDQYGNWRVPMTVVVMSNLDSFTVDVHDELQWQIQRTLELPSSRHHSRVQGLYVYDLIQTNVGISNEGRRMISVINYDLMVNYSPETSSP